MELTPELGELFAGYWARVMPPHRHGNIAMPFFHLRADGFWHLVARPGQEEALAALNTMTSMDGHTAVDAAHIVPWSVSHNDDPRNGMALCRLCHWTFDEGLLGVSQRYLWLRFDCPIRKWCGMV